MTKQQEQSLAILPLAGLRLGIMSAGLWTHRADIERLTGATTFRLGMLQQPRCDAVLGWGHKPTSMKALTYATGHTLPYIAMEDGFIRSVSPGDDIGQLGYVLDRSGIYYDASTASDLEGWIAKARSSSVEGRARATAALTFIRDRRISKYNHAPMRTPSELGLIPGQRRVLVVDQVVGDASIGGSGAAAEDFLTMLNAARDENPGAAIVVKLHPEAIGYPDRSHLAAAARTVGATVVDVLVNPWALLEECSKVYVVSSQLGFEALIAGLPVTCFGSPFYAHWGLTDDRKPPIPRRQPGVNLDDIAAALLFDYSLYLDPWTRCPISFEQAADALVFLRDAWQSNRSTVALGIAPWKRKAVERFLAGPGERPIYATDQKMALELARDQRKSITVWAAREPRRLESQAGKANVPIVRMEDGFLRSVGLGAAFNAPASLVMDRTGIFFDPAHDSDFQTLANTQVFSPALLARAAELRLSIVSTRITKYNVGRDAMIEMPANREIVLVPGQVSDDASVRMGAPGKESNLDLLRAVRTRHPSAFILYKPHPDVQDGLRVGRVSRRDALRYADRVVTGVSIATLLGRCDRVETLTSLTGFEALLRGVAVTAHGAPFYAGWGLCESLMPTPGRQRTLALDALVAVALILYPRYVDPVSGLPCHPEMVVRRLAEQRNRPMTMFDVIGAAVRRRAVWTTHNMIGPVHRQIKALTNRARFEDDD